MALADSSRANAEAAKSKENNTQLRVELEKERIERLRLEAKVQPRHLSNAQRQALTEKIKSSDWKNSEIIWHGTGEREAYAKDLASVFEKRPIGIDHSATQLLQHQPSGLVSVAHDMSGLGSARSVR